MDESLPVVVSQMLVVIVKSTKSSSDKPAGSVVMVEVTMGTGPTVSVEPSVVIVSTPVIVAEPRGTVKIIVEPSGSVRVSAMTAGIAVKVIVTPSVVTVSKPPVERGGSVPPVENGTSLPPSGHHAGAGGHVGPGLPIVTVLAGDGASTAGPCSDSSFPLKAETDHS